MSIINNVSSANDKMIEIGMNELIYHQQNGNTSMHCTWSWKYVVRFLLECIGHNKDTYAFGQSFIDKWDTYTCNGDVKLQM